MSLPPRVTAALVLALVPVLALSCDDSTGPSLGTGFDTGEFALVTAGSFPMGDSVFNGQGPIHTVTITYDFYMQKTEVTQGQWESVMGNNPAYFASGDAPAPGCFEETCPVEYVTWENIQAFLQQLNSRGDGWTYRLPTEAEWEYAARAGVTDMYPANPGAVAWYVGNAEAVTHPVAQKQANAWGLYDMLGNVTEYCQDWWDPGYYWNSPATDPPGPQTGVYKISRGGSHASTEVNLSYTIRASFPTNETARDRGFRLVRTQ